MPNVKLNLTILAQNTLPDSHQILEGVYVSFDQKKMTKADQEDILNVMRTVAAGVKARNETNKLAQIEMERDINWAAGQEKAPPKKKVG